MDVILSHQQIVKKSKKTRKLLEFIGKTDRLVDRVNKLFPIMQKHWQDRNYQSIKV